MPLDINRVIGFESESEGSGWRTVAIVLLPGTKLPSRFESFAPDEVTAMANVAEQIQTAYEAVTRLSSSDAPHVDPKAPGKAAILASLVDVDDMIETPAETPAPVADAPDIAAPVATVDDFDFPV